MLLARPVILGGGGDFQALNQIYKINNVIKRQKKTGLPIKNQDRRIYQRHSY